MAAGDFPLVWKGGVLQAPLCSSAQKQTRLFPLSLGAPLVGNGRGGPGPSARGASCCLATQENYCFFK